VASLREVRNDFFVNSYAFGMEPRFKDGEDSVIMGVCIVLQSMSYY
jgi:hypothetical protein